MLTEVPFTVGPPAPAETRAERQARKARVASANGEIETRATSKRPISGPTRNSAKIESPAFESGET